MSFFPQIKSIQEYNELVNGCGCSCPLPPCAEPVIQSQTKPFYVCFYTQMVDGVLKYFRTQKNTSIGDRNLSTVVNGFVLSSYVEDWTIVQTSTFTLTDECRYDTNCQGSGVKTARTYYTRVEEVDGQFQIVATYPQNEVDETLSAGEGLPDPTWTPGPNQTEDDRPTLPKCSFIWTRQIRSYDAIIDQGVVTGSVLSSTETRYEKVLLSTTPFDAVAAEYFDEVGCSDLRESLLTPSFDGIDVSYYLPISEFKCTDNPVVPVPFSFLYSRYRWVVPPEHEGSYYRIDWDEVFFPKAFLDWQVNPVGPPPVLPTLTPKSWVWTGTALGPCCGEETDTYQDRLDDPSRKSPWGIMPPPNSAGRVEIRNVRVVCYVSQFSLLPYDCEGYPTFSLDDLNENGIPDANE